MIKAVTTLVAFSLLGYACSRQDKSVPLVQAALVKTDTLQVNIDFDRDIKSILTARCTPCHFPGGKMYSKLPFDNPQTIRDHPDGIFRRIKDAEEVKKLKAFLEQKVL